VVARRRRELGLDIDVEGFAVHGAVQNPRGDHPVVRQTCDESLRAPSPEGSRAEQPFADGAAPAQSGDVGLDGSLVDEDQTMRLGAHGRLAVTRLSNLLSVNLAITVAVIPDLSC